MSKSLEFVTNGHIVTVTYTKRKCLSQSYSQTFINIKVAQEGKAVQQGKEEILYEVDLDDNYILTSFPNLSLFYSYLNKHRKQDIVMYNRCDQITVMVQVDESDIQEEIIQLNKIQIVDQQQYESIVNRENFYSDVFKTKIIQKIEKTVKNYYRAKGERKEERKYQKVESTDNYVSFKVQGKDQDFHLQHEHPSVEFDLPSQIFSGNQLVFKIKSLKSDKLYVYADYFNAASNSSIGTKRFLQFGKSYSSSFWIDEGHTIAVYREEGQLVIKNVTSNDGKIFDESIINKDDVLFKITVSLKQIL